MWIDVNRAARGGLFQIPVIFIQHSVDVWQFRNFVGHGGLHNHPNHSLIGMLTAAHYRKQNM